MKWGFQEEGLCFDTKIKTQVFDAKRGEFGAGRLGEIIGQVSEPSTPLTALMRGRGPAVADITLTTGHQLPWIGKRLSRKNQLARWSMLREPSISLIMLRRRRPADCWV